MPCLALTCFPHDQGGQSATGALLDHIIATHPASPRVRDRAATKGQTIYEALNELVQTLARERCAHSLHHQPPLQSLTPATPASSPRGVAFRAQLTRDLHVFPDFHGNRFSADHSTLSNIGVGLTKPLCCTALRPNYVGRLVPMRRCAG